MYIYIIYIYNIYIYNIYIYIIYIYINKDKAQESQCQIMKKE